MMPSMPDDGSQTMDTRMNALFRYRRLGYLVMNVTDIERATRFAVDIFGLDMECERADGSRCFRAGSHHHDVILVQAEKAALARAAWELENDRELKLAFRHFSEQGLKPAWVGGAECDDLRIERAFRIVDPAIGMTWEFYADMNFMPAIRKNPLARFQGGKHFGLLVPDSHASSAYLMKEMGFACSDYFAGHNGVFMRAWPNPNHHSLAMFSDGSDVTRLHHVAFMVEEIDDIGRLFNRIRRHQVDIQFGIGRHPTSYSIHLYIYGPDNFVWEYTLGMEQFAETGAREARRMSDNPGDFDLWGAVPDGSRLDVLPEVLLSRG